MIKEYYEDFLYVLNYYKPGRVSIALVGSAQVRGLMNTCILNTSVMRNCTILDNLVYCFTCERVYVT